MARDAASHARKHHNAASDVLSPERRGVSCRYADVDASDGVGAAPMRADARGIRPDMVRCRAVDTAQNSLPMIFRLCRADDAPTRHVDRRRDADAPRTLE